MKRQSMKTIAGVSIALAALGLGGTSRAEVIVADFADDFPPSGGPNAWYNGSEASHPGWSYLRSSNSTIGVSSTYRPLEKGIVDNPIDPVWVFDGDFAYNSTSQPERWMRLGAVPDAMHPGDNNQPIAAYTIQASDGAGFYAIANSMLTNLANTVDGVDLSVYVNDGLKLLLDGVKVYNKPATNFNVTLGYLNVGDTVYVAYGENVGIGADNGQIDFTIVKRYDLISDFKNDFPPSGGPNAWYNGTETPHPGWSYLYASNSTIGTASSYRPLEKCIVTSSVSPSWVYDGDYAYNSTSQSGGQYMRLAVASVHPGSALLNPIAAYTIQPADGGGDYVIIDSLMKNLNASADGVDLRVYVNNTLKHILNQVNTFGGANTNFNVTLGTLKVGDTVYVAYGPHNNITNDGGEIDFTLGKVSSDAPSRGTVLTVW